MRVPKSENAFVGNAEEDSMGRAVVGGVRVDNNISPRRAAIEKAQAALRQEYDVREETKKELEFLEKGGNPLDFKADLATSTSPHSTSVTDHLEEQFVISEARGSATLPVSPFADSVESSGRLGSLLSKDLSSADNLFVFDGHDKMTEGKRNSFHFSKSRARVGNASLLKESDSAILRHEVKGQAYARRNRSRPNRDSAQLHITNLVNSGNTNVSFNVPSIVSEPNDVKRLTCEEEMTAGPMNLSIHNSEAASPNENVDSRLLDSDNQHICADGTQNFETKIEFIDDPLPDVVEGTRHSENNQVLQIPGEPDDHMVKDVNNLVSGQADCGHDKVFDAIQNPGSLSNYFGLSAEDGNNVRDEDQKKECVISKKLITDSVTNEQTEASNLLLDPVCCDHDDAEKKLNNAPSSDFVLLDETANESHEGDQMKELDHAPEGDQIKELDHAPDAALIVNEQIEINSLVPDKFGCGTNAPDAGLIVNEQIETNILVPGNISCDANELSKVYSPPSQEISTVFDVVMLKDNTDATDVLSNDSKANDAKASSTTHIDEPYNRNTDQQSSENPDDVGTSKQDCSDTLKDDLISKNNNLMEGSSVNLLPPFKNEPLLFTQSQLCVESALEETHDDAILEKARVIEVNRKRLGQFPASSFCSEIRRKSHWDFVIEEMAWLANDFMQERAWKIAAASQVSHLVALSGRSKLNDAIVRQKQKLAAHSLAKSVIKFWNSAKVLFRKNVSDHLEPLSKCSMFEDLVLEGNDNTPDMSGNRNFKTREDNHSIMAYAIRFLKDNIEISSSSAHAVAPRTPDRLYDCGIMASSEDTAELRVNLFFAVPFGAMENYRKSIESLWMHYEKNGDGIHSDERLTTWLDSESGALENTYEEDECDPDMLYFPESADKHSRSAHKKKYVKKQLQRTYEIEPELAYGNFSNSHILINGKRPLNSPHVGSIPTKRARTAARQRVSGPLMSVPTQMLAKTDVSSGDTCSYQDDQSSQHGEPQMQKNFEVESTGEYGRQLPDGTSISLKHKKKKKGYKNSLHTADSDTYLFPPGESTQDHRWQWDSNGQHEQKRKLEAHNFDSNASNGPGSTPSVASQMSNMAYPNKFMKLLANRGPGKKAKALKISGVSSGAGDPWSVVEDQALVVLVHDMGPNWELVSDIMNSALHFKCIFRKPKECRERHKILMDRNSGDGADSAEDSGSSQPYPSTLPGIPKGSARQLFQHLQGPLEQDVLKSHFEKIIKIGQHLLERNQNNNCEAKQTIPIHGSHVIALSQVCPNGINSAILTPLDLCDATSSSPDTQSLGYPGSHSGGMPVSHQGSLSSTISSSFVNNAVPVTSAMALSNGFTQTSAALSPSSRYGGPRSAPAPLDEQQRIQQYNQMISGRNVQQSTMPNSGTLQVGNDRAVRMVPGSNGMGMICSMNRGVGVPRQGFQGMASAPMLNMISSGNVIPNSGLPGPVNIHPGHVSGQGNSLPRPRESLAAIRPGQNLEDQRRMMQEFQMQGPQGHCQGTPTSFSGMSPAFTNPMVTSPVKNIPLQHQSQQQLHLLNGPQHPPLQGANSGSPQQQAFVNRVAKDRQMQQRFMPQQQQFTSANPSVSYPTGPPQFQAHHPVSPIQNGLQPTAPASLPIPSAQHSLTQSSSQQGAIPAQANPKQNQTSQGLGQLGVSLTNQALLKRHRQQLLQQRSHTSQNRQQANSVQQAKHAKGLGRGNVMMHQNFPIEPAHVNNLSSPNEILDKGEPAMQQMILTQGLYPGTAALNACQPGRQLLPQPSNSLQHQQKQFSRAHTHKQVSLPNGHADGNNQGQALQVQPNQILSSSLSPVSSSSLSMQTSLSRPSLQRMLPANNLQRCHSDVPLSGPLEQNHIIHMSSNSNATQCTDASIIAPSVSPASSSTSHWKVDSPSCDSNVTVPSHRHLPNNGCVSQRTPSRVESGQSSQPMGQRQCSGSNTLVHESNTDDQWHQGSQIQPQQNRQLVQQHQSIDAGSLCSQPTNSSSG